MCIMKELAQIGIGSTQQILSLNFLIGEAKNWSHTHTHTQKKTSYKTPFLEPGLSACAEWILCFVQEMRLRTDL